MEPKDQDLDDLFAPHPGEGIGRPVQAVAPVDEPDGGYDPVADQLPVLNDEDDVRVMLDLLAAWRSELADYEAKGRPSRNWASAKTAVRSACKFMRATVVDARRSRLATQLSTALDGLYHAFAFDVGTAPANLAGFEQAFAELCFHFGVKPAELLRDGLLTDEEQETVVQLLARQPVSAPLKQGRTAAPAWTRNHIKQVRLGLKAIGLPWPGSALEKARIDLFPPSMGEASRGVVVAARILGVSARTVYGDRDPTEAESLAADPGLFVHVRGGQANRKRRPSKKKPSK